MGMIANLYYRTSTRPSVVKSNDPTNGTAQVLNQPMARRVREAKDTYGATDNAVFVHKRYIQ